MKVFFAMRVYLSKSFVIDLMEQECIFRFEYMFSYYIHIFIIHIYLNIKRVIFFRELKCVTSVELDMRNKNIYINIFSYSLGTDNTHILAIRNAQEIEVFQQGDGMWHLQR